MSQSHIIPSSLRAHTNAPNKSFLYVSRMCADFGIPTHSIFPSIHPDLTMHILIVLPTHSNLRTDKLLSHILLGRASVFSFIFSFRLFLAVHLYLSAFCGRVVCFRVSVFFSSSNHIHTCPSPEFTHDQFSWLHV